MPVSEIEPKLELLRRAMNEFADTLPVARNGAAKVLCIRLKVTLFRALSSAVTAEAAVSVPPARRPRFLNFGFHRTRSDHEESSLFALVLLASTCVRAGREPVPTGRDECLERGISAHRFAAGRVQIRIKAPEANKVKLNFWSGPKVDMEKQADGFWTVTTTPLVPGLHYYVINVDGADCQRSRQQGIFRRRRAT